jgi:uncharacterized cupredoxin-like copper-binding protein
MTNYWQLATICLGFALLWIVYHLYIKNDPNETGEAGEKLKYMKKKIGEIKHEIKLDKQIKREIKQEERQVDEKIKGIPSDIDSHSDFFDNRYGGKS